MIRVFLALLSCIVFNNAHANLWQDTSSTELRQLRGTPALQAQQNQVFRFDEARLLQLDMAALANHLNAAQSEGAMNSAVTIQLPLPHGEFVDYLLYLSPVMAPALAAKYPEIRTFKVVSVDNPADTGRLDLTPQGFHAVLRHHTQTVFIDPLGNSNHYQSYYKRDYAARKTRSGQHKAFVCKSGNHTIGAVEPLLAERLLNTADFAQRAKRLSFGSQIKTYRLAIAATGEFTQFHGGTKVKGLAALVTGINRINEVYERDLAVKLEMVADNDKLIYENSATDPFDGSSALADLIGPVINQEIGISNYDVGHVINGNGDGGQAGLSVVCNDSSKAEGETSSDTPINDPFFIDFVAHELGHQFGSQHSFNGRSNSCGGGNRSGSHAYEPGSGSTIMGYAGICFNEDLQPNSDAYFHSDSIEQIRAHLNSDTGNTCGVASDSNNQLPTIEAGDNKVIPKLTPFTLTGSGSDVDGDTLTYTWEQLNLGPATRSRAGLVDNGSSPIFRSFMPTNSPTRTLPQLSDVLAGTTTYGEVMPSTSRDLNFRLTVRDGKGGVASDGMIVQVVSSAGPFTVTSPTSGNWSSGTQAITWDVANTDMAPVSCSTVKIDLSTNGGNTFPTTLLASTTNNGSAMVTVPALNTTRGRIRISCTTQPFFAVNSANLTINSTMAPPEPANQIPNANADSYEVSQDSAFSNFTVLDNDTDADGDNLIVSVINNISAGGTVTIASDGKSVNYQPATGFTGTEVINYTIRDSRGDTASANFTVIVKASENGNDDDTNNDSSGGGGSTGLLFLFSLLLLVTMRIQWSHLLPNPAERATKDND